MQPGSSALTAVVAVLLVITLGVGGIVVAVDRTDGDDGRVADGEVSDDDAATTTTIEAMPPTEAELEVVVRDLSAFVADARGREFLEPVEVTLLGDADFTARVEGDAIEDLDELDEIEGVFRAFGLIDEGVDLAESLRAFLGAGVVGFYDPETGELVVRGASLTPYVRLTLVHELTHALDDQHFELHRPALEEADDETGFAFSALVEGSALHVEDLYRETLTDDERAAADAEEARLGAGFDFTRIPRVLPELIGFPYIFGPGLVEELVDQGGNDRIDEAFDEPPVSTEQVLDPESWLDGEAEPVSVPPPAADGEVIDEGVLGLWGLYLILGPELGTDDAVEAARGWGGDWYVAWMEGDETCVRATVVMDSGGDLRELAAGLDQWAGAQDDAEVIRGERDVTLESCG